MSNLIIDILGWSGSAMLVLAYWLVSKNKISAQSFIYQFLNVLGSILLIVNTWFYGAYPSTAVNAIWVFVGGFFLLKNALKNNSEISKES